MEISLARDIMAFCLSQTQEWPALREGPVQFGLQCMEERAAEELRRRRRGERCLKRKEQCSKVTESSLGEATASSAAST